MKTWVGGILVGGDSRRMGTDKASLPWQRGQTMAAHCAAVLKPICSRVVTVGRHNTPAEITDERVDAGPLAGVEALLHSDLGTDYLIVCCDQPLVTTPVLELLKGDDDLAFFRNLDGSIEPFPMHVAASMAASCTASLDTGARSVLVWMRSSSGHPIDLPDDHIGTLTSLNSPDQYIKARSLADDFDDGALECRRP